MINTDMRTYNYYIYGAQNAYGQATLSSEVKGQIKMAIYTSSQTVTDNIKYKDASYIGLTQSAVDDTYVIQSGAEKLKVLYVQPKGKYKQVFLKEL